MANKHKKVWKVVSRKLFSRKQTQPKTIYSKKVFLFLKSTFVSPKLAQTQVKIILNLTSKGILKKITRELFIFFNFCGCRDPPLIKTKNFNFLSWILGSRKMEVTSK
jgi:hypothetical protein